MPLPPQLFSMVCFQHDSTMKVLCLVAAGVPSEFRIFPLTAFPSISKGGDSGFRLGLFLVN